jgi:predicted 2-oxoglutarate/Fe(II)-dependent dioxygenase YbiX
MDVKDYINVFDQFIEVKKISSLVKWLNKQKFFHAETLGGLNKNIRSAEQINLNNKDKSLTNVHWFNYLVYKFTELIKNYNSKMFNDTCTSGFTEIIALKYEKGDYYDVHTDNHTRVPRTLSIILFLNDDYEGGSVTFKCPKTNKDILNVSPKAGRVIIFPSNFMYPHTVNNVTKGCRYSIVAWIN